MYVFLWICCDILQIMAADSLQRRLTGRGVTVSAIHPGIVSVHVMYCPYYTDSVLVNLVVMFGKGHFE